MVLFWSCCKLLYITALRLLQRRVPLWPFYLKKERTRHIISIPHATRWNRTIWMNGFETRSSCVHACKVNPWMNPQVRLQKKCSEPACRAHVLMVYRYLCPENRFGSRATGSSESCLPYSTSWCVPTAYSLLLYSMPIKCIARYCILQNLSGLHGTDHLRLAWTYFSFKACIYNLVFKGETGSDNFRPNPV